jgi:hypothetical protein
LHLARPCAPDGSFLKEPVPVPEPVQPPDATPDNDWAPFPDRLAFDWAQYHFMRLQLSEDVVTEGLDLWRATVIKHASDHRAHGHVPWRDVQDLYKMLNSIQAGAVGWKTYKFHYTGLKLQTPPRWMLEMYELNARDVLLL